jgi:hypothetical protein
MRAQESSSARFWGSILVAPAAAAIAGAGYFLVTAPYPSTLAIIPLILITGYVIAFVHTLALGMPLFILLDRHWRLNWWNAALCGAIIGALPVLVLSLSDSLGGTAVFCTGCGVAGGLAFRAVIGTSPP